MRAACTEFSMWRAKGIGREIVLRLNVSPVQLVAEGFADAVADTLADFGLSGESICLEITESLVVQDIETTRITLAALKEVGVQIAIDDFGTGYSVLTHLKSLPVDTLKIDRSFVQDLGSNAGDLAIVRPMRSVCRWSPRAWKPPPQPRYCCGTAVTGRRASCCRGRSTALRWHSCWPTSTSSCPSVEGLQLQSGKPAERPRPDHQLGGLGSGCRVQARPRLVAGRDDHPYGGTDHDLAAGRAQHDPGHPAFDEHQIPQYRSGARRQPAVPREFGDPLVDVDGCADRDRGDRYRNGARPGHLGTQQAQR